MTELSASLPDEIEGLIASGSWAALAAADIDWPDAETVAPELVDLLLELPRNDRVLFFRALPREVAVEVFSELHGKSRDELLVALTDGETRDLLAAMTPDDRTHLLGELPGQATQRLLNLLSAEDLREAQQLLGYPEGSVGRLMTPEYLAVRRSWTVSRALQHIRELGAQKETVDVVFVVDERWHLQDDLPLHKLVLAQPDQRVEEIMDESFVSVEATARADEALRLMQRYDRIALPVVDSSGVLVGIVTVDDVLDFAEQAATEDMQRIGGSIPLHVRYWEASVGLLYRARIGWLAALVLVNLISSSVIALYENVLASVIALAFFIPLIIDTGGNAGSQSATTMIRALSTGEVRGDEWLRVAGKETLLGLAIGPTLGALGFILGWFRGGAELGLALGLVVMVTMILMLLVTNLMGVLLPFLLIRLRFDPAVASGPLITSIADAVGLIVYFSVASFVLGHVLA